MNTRPAQRAVEIGNMLRHHGLASTTIYARVRIDKLRELAPALAVR